MSTAERLKQYLEYKKIPPYRAENECGLSSSSLSKALPNKDKGVEGKSIGSDNLEKILSTYKDLSSEWLLRGTGTMIIGDGVDHEQILKSINLPVNSREIVEMWMKFMSVTVGMQDLYKQTLEKI